MKYKRLILPFIAIVVIVILGVHHVPLSVTDADKNALSSILGLDDIQQYATQNQAFTFDDEIEQIRLIQSKILEIAPHLGPIEHGLEREPTNLLNAKYGHCFDRSRSIEKALRIFGYEVRHVALYKYLGSTLETLTASGKPSHSITEVKTSKGWMIVDSNDAWISLDKDGQPISVAQLAVALEQEQNIAWENPDAYYSHIYKAPFIYIYGLYSRHGMFYPPMTPIPDISWNEALYNLK